MRAAVVLVVSSCLTLALSSLAGGRQSPGPAGTIAVSGGSLHGKRQIALISPASRTTRFVRVPDDVVKYDLSPDGRVIAVTGFKGIWTLRRDGSQARRILTQSLDEQHPFGAGAIAWSPDGRRLVFARSDAVLFTLGSDGKNLRRIIRDGDQPDWTPDGRRIVFVRHPARQTDWAGFVSIISSDRRGLRRIVPRGTWNEPRVSPDGSQVGFVDSRGIFLAPMKDGGKGRLLIRDGYGLAWSPDGRYMAFARPIRCDAVCVSRVFIVPTSGGKARAYGPEIGDMGSLSWSR